MVAQARRRNAQGMQEGLVDLRWGSVEQLPFADGQFDRALAANSLHHWPNPITNLWEVQRVLKPGGRLVIAQQPVWAAKDADDLPVRRRTYRADHDRGVRAGRDGLPTHVASAHDLRAGCQTEVG